MSAFYLSETIALTLSEIISFFPSFGYRDNEAIQARIINARLLVACHSLLTVIYTNMKYHRSMNQSSYHIMIRVCFDVDFFDFRKATRYHTRCLAKRRVKRQARGLFWLSQKNNGKEEEESRSLLTGIIVIFAWNSIRGSTLLGTTIGHL